MPNDDTSIGLARDLTASIDELQAALQRAGDAASTLRALAPRVAAVGSLFDDLEAVMLAGRQQVGPLAAQSAPQAIYGRPTLVAPSPAAEPSMQPPARAETPPGPAQPVLPEIALSERDTLAGDTQAEPQAAALTCFRLEFESTPGPLDLRTVDDAVSEHPDVRDVALLDYDGRRATLKVWIVASAQPSSVQESLTARASKLFGKSNDVSVIALEDVA